MRCFRFTLLLALGVLAFAPTLAGAEPPVLVEQPLWINDQVYDQNGDPFLIAARSSDQTRSAVWEQCTVWDPRCKTIPSKSGIAKPGKTAAGTTFRVHLSGVDNPEYVTSDPWGGRVVASKAPSATGEIAGMSKLRLKAGEWHGGWPKNHDSLTVLACRKSTSKKCEVVTGVWYRSGPQEHTPIGERYVGWRLYLANYHDPPDQQNIAIETQRERYNPLLDPQANIAIKYLGRVADNPDYSVALRSHTHVSRGLGVAIGKVKCPSTCRVRIFQWEDFLAGHPAPAEWHRRVHRSGTLRVPRKIFESKAEPFMVSIDDALMDSRVVHLSK
jgi:hypothetical protein